MENEQNLEIITSEEILVLDNIFATGLTFGHPQNPNGLILKDDEIKHEAAEIRIKAADSNGDYSLKRNGEVYEEGEIKQIYYVSQRDNEKKQQFYFSQFSKYNVKPPRLLKRKISYSPIEEI